MQSQTEQIVVQGKYNGEWVTVSNPWNKRDRLFCSSIKSAKFRRMNWRLVEPDTEFRIAKITTVVNTKVEEIEVA